MVATREVIRLVGAVARLADSRLAYGAARNAAACVRDQQAKRLDDARLLHELGSVQRAVPQAVPGPARRRTSG